jgi:hypothetical protein
MAGVPPKHVGENIVNEIRNRILSALCWLFTYLWNKTDLKERGCEGYVMDRSGTVTGSSADLPVTQKTANLTVWATITFSCRTLQQGLG